MNSKISKSSLVSYIACSNYQPQLRRLDLNFKSKLWVDVLMLKDWSEVLALQLSCCQINDSSIDFLLSMDLPNLLELDLSVNIVSAIGVQSLIKKLKHRLQILNLRNNQITDSSVRHIFDAERISHINLSDNRISAVGMSHILNESSETLKKLNLNNNPIGCKGLKFLIKANFPALEQLRVVKCRVGKEGLIHLVKSNWDCLLTLSIGNFYFYEDSTDLQFDSLFLLAINNNWAKFTNLIGLDKVKQAARIGVMLFENLLDEKKKKISDF